MAEAVKNAFVKSGDNNKNTGKETGLIHAPEVSLEPTSQDSADKNNSNWRSQEKKFMIIDDANKASTDPDKPDVAYYKQYPFLDLELDQGVFIPNRPGLTTDDLMAQLHRDIYRTREFLAEVERDENGDEILECLCVLPKKRNEDGTVQLEGGKPIVGANFVQRPKLVTSRHFTVRSVVKDYDLGGGKKAPEDGVLVIRSM